MKFREYINTLIECDGGDFGGDVADLGAVDTSSDTSITDIPTDVDTSDIYDGTNSAPADNPYNYGGIGTSTLDIAPIERRVGDIRRRKPRKRKISIQ